MQVTGKPKWIGSLLVSGFVVVGSIFTGCTSAYTARIDNSTDATFGQLFTGSPCGQSGTLGCIDAGHTCNPDWQSYFTSTDNSITITAGNDCRTVSTHDSCQFTLGTGGLTQISFDFTVSESCHGTQGTEWLSFWIYREPWVNTVEVDFIESAFGPSSGLNTNFAGTGNQVVIFDSSSTSPWTGTITATFTGTDGAVDVQVSNSINTNIGTTTLTANDGYFFVLDTATGSSAPDCTITISNLAAQGSVASGTCSGLTVTSDS